MKDALRRELPDVALLAALAVAVPFVWLVIGWDPTLSVGGRDTLESFIPFTGELVRAGGDWRSVAYRADLSGGVVLVTILCAFPVTRMLAAAGAPLLTVVAGTYFFLQVLAGYLGAKTVTDLAALWRETRLPPETARPEEAPDAGDEVERARAVAGEIGTCLLVGLAFAFAPILGWRIAGGHPGLIAGTFVFSGSLLLAVSVLSRRLTITAILVTVLAFMHAFQSMSAQLAVYGVVFGGPLIAGLILSFWKPLAAEREGRLRLLAACLAPFVLGLSGLLLSWDVFDAIYRSATNSDFARQHEDSAIYSFVVGRARDWLLSIPWSYGLVDPERPVYLRHETNYPFGPALVLLALVPWRRGGARFSAWILTPLVLSVIAAICLSCDVAPISKAMLRVVPVLRDFRVPARAVTPACLTVLTLGLAGALTTGRARFTRLVGGLALVSFLAVFVAPAWAFEIVIVAVAVAVALSGRLPVLARARAWWSPTALVVLMAMGSVVGFRERQPPSVNVLAQSKDVPRIHALIQAQIPGAESSLRRAAVQFEQAGVGMNTGLAVGVSTLNGYANPTTRFTTLLGAIEHKSPDYMRVYVLILPERRDFRVWSALYNVTHTIYPEGNGVRAIPTGQPDRPAWFSARLVAVEDERALAAALLAAPDPAAALLDAGWYVRSDAFTARVADEPIGPPDACERARVVGVDAPRGQRFKVMVETPARCPLTLSTNFTELFRARVRTRDGRWEDARVFPVYGALTGVLVPAGATEVEVEAIVEKRASGWLASLAGALLLAVVVLATTRRSGALSCGRADL